MKKNHTDITILLDRSASMSGLTNTTIEGFNEFVNAQKEVEGTASLTVVQFAEPDKIQNFITAQDIKSVAPLTHETYVANGHYTAYLDAIGRTINETGERLHNLRISERPDKVIFVVLTDGLENASREFTRSAIRDMIKHQEEKYSWEFVFLGANMDAVAEGGSIGVTNGKSFTYTATAAGMSNAFKSVTANSVMYRSNVKSDMSFTDEDRKAQEVSNTTAS